MAEQSKRPRTGQDWDQRYLEGRTPWDRGEPDRHLARVLIEFEIEPGRSLDIGCGTGTNSLWLATQGFRVTGLDISQVAIERADGKAREAGVEANFLAADFLRDSLPEGPFDFVCDRGCFHSFQDPGDRSRFADRVADLLRPDGIWHSLIGSTDGPPRDAGPPRRSARDVTQAVEPHFEILDLRSTHFGSGPHGEARAWILVARRRGD